jgi:hypothetical protein
MPGRHQILRHLDCAWEFRGRKQVIGFFIVQGEEVREEVPAKWREVAKDTISVDTIASSLPHRGPEEQSEIASCFAGVTTWEKVCREFDIEPKILPDVAAL